MTVGSGDLGGDNEVATAGSRGTSVYSVILWYYVRL